MAGAPARRGRLVRGDRPRAPPSPVDRVLLGAPAWSLVGARLCAFGPWRPRTRRTGCTGRRRAQHPRDSRPSRTEPGVRPTLAERLRTPHARLAPTDARGSVRDGPCLCGARADDLRALRKKRPLSVSALPPPTRSRPSATRKEHPPRRGRGLLSGLWIRPSPVGTAFSPRRSDHKIVWPSAQGCYAVARPLPSRGTKVCPAVRELPRGGRSRPRSATLLRRDVTPPTRLGERETS